ncbi:AraC family transcriptional regulator [Corynebacterium doosanense]|uniref:AraC family transcriptional regulator n=1 Tax=Corynebacterium doosanense CAU 212 = DSM 45436 TaxID=558173 RepID=A0A097IIR1_9CORY|nr:helix-turn-helix domain-containing protein [Corynebacterium doosanense]AIT62022.1 AraC family transcriptional regulator [Corynebacterium doosanense CAU 212 = DSM 45436]
MTTTGDSRGILFPGQLPAFERVDAPEDIRDRVEWFWIPRWELTDGATSTQTVLPFPASHLVVEHGHVNLYGPTTGISVRVLSGHDWAFGMRLRPAGLAALTSEPAEFLDTYLSFAAPGLLSLVTTPMRAGENTAAVRAAADWVRREIAGADDTGRTANAMVDLIAADRSITSVGELAERMRMSVRSVQRLSARYIGLSPLAVIRRYRLQEAAVQLRARESVAMGDLAAQLGYADQSHMCADFRGVLGITPGEYRRVKG